MKLWARREVIQLRNGTIGSANYVERSCMVVAIAPPKINSKPLVCAVSAIALVSAAFVANDLDIQSRLRYQHNGRWIVYVKLPRQLHDALDLQEYRRSSLDDCFRIADRLVIVQMFVPANDLRLRLREGKIVDTRNKQEIEEVRKLFSVTRKDSDIYGWGDCTFQLFQGERLIASPQMCGTEYVRWDNWNSCAKLNTPIQMTDWLRARGATFCN
jgi:hypothetical protein